METFFPTHRSCVWDRDWEGIREPALPANHLILPSFLDLYLAPGAFPPRMGGDTPPCLEKQPNKTQKDHLLGCSCNSSSLACKTPEPRTSASAAPPPLPTLGPAAAQPSAGLWFCRPHLGRLAPTRVPWPRRNPSPNPHRTSPSPQKVAFVYWREAWPAISKLTTVMLHITHLHQAQPLNPPFFLSF